MRAFFCIAFCIRNYQRLLCSNQFVQRMFRRALGWVFSTWPAAIAAIRLQSWSWFASEEPGFESELGESQATNPGWWWMVAMFYVPRNIGVMANHPNWRTPSFFRGVAQPPTSTGITLVVSGQFRRVPCETQEDLVISCPAHELWKVNVPARSCRGNSGCGSNVLLAVGSPT